MNPLTNLIHGLKSLFAKRRTDRELDEELQSYLEASVADKQRSGLSRHAARYAAKVEIGSAGSVKHQVWSSRWESTLDSLFQDLRLSIRSLAKSPGFTLVALLSLALGIGANTAIFTLIHQVLLRNLPVQHPEQIVNFGNGYSSGVAGGIDLGDFGMFPNYFARQLEADPGPFQGIASYGSFSDKVSLRLPPSDSTPNAPAILVPATLVSGNYFRVLGAEPMIGRALTPADDNTPGASPVIVISHHFWRQSLSADPAVLGKTLSINGTAFSIVGVMPPAFFGLKQELEPVDLWAPVSMQAQVLKQPSFLNRDGPYFLHIFGRVSAQAASNPSIAAQSQNWLDQQIRNGIRANEGTVIAPAREQEILRHTVQIELAVHGVSTLRRQFGGPLMTLMVVVALVLLIACANLANFLLARAASRQREIATRLALGSSRGRIVRQSLVETLLLSLAGGATGLVLAFAATRALIAFVSQGAAFVAIDPSPDLTVLAFTLGVSLLTAFLFGIAPAFAVARTGAAFSLSSNARTAQGAGGRSARFWPRALVTAQVMLSLVLLVGSGLFLRTLNNLENQDYGFERSNLLLAEINAKLAGYKPSQAPALHQAIIERLSALPGVRSVALSLTPPISGGNWTSSFKPQGYTPAPKENMVAVLNRVSGQYFETAGIRIIAGRAINPDDSLTSIKVAVINETLARHFYPHGDAVGRTLSIDTSSVAGPWRIVGITRDTRSGDPRQTNTDRMIYMPLAQMPAFEPVDPDHPLPAGAAPEENQNRFISTVLVRTTGDPAKAAAGLRTVIAQIDPNLPVLKVQTIHDAIDSFMTRDTLVSRLTGIFSLLALVLAAIGLYGVMSYSVVRRTSEIGIRLALGAQTGTVLWMVLRESLVLLAVGVGLGLPLALASTQVIRGQLYGLSPLDPITFAAAIAIVAAMTLIAAWLPARLASKVDPMVALRCD
ncbi:MAG TPA: ABC transporter permease [Acidobacteriaceae bacterium]|jgi:predicted permease|nr:ABC transporter permease [Acidobacteriaceae bacterium]